MADGSKIATLVKTSLRNPREGARLFLSIPFDGRSTAELIAAAILLGSVTEFLFATILVTVSGASGESPGQIGRALEQVVAVGPMTLVFAGALAFAMRWGLLVMAGRLFGGRGRPDESARLLAWYDILWSVLFLAVLVIALAMPPIGLLLMLLAGIWGVWMMIEFVAALHGWENRLLIFIGLIGGYLLLQLFLGMIPL